MRCIQHTHTQPFNGPFSGTTRVSRYQKGNTNLDFCEARDSEWQWHQLGCMQVCTSLQTDNHASTPLLSFYRPDALPAAQPTASKHWRHTWDAYNQPENANWLSVKDKGCQIQRTAMNFWNYIFPNTVWVSFAISVVLCVVPYEVIWYKILYNIVQHNNNYLQPVYRSTCVSRHLQLRTGGFYWYKVLLPTCLCWREPAHSG